MLLAILDFHSLSIKFWWVHNLQFQIPNAKTFWKTKTFSIWPIHFTWLLLNNHLTCLSCPLVQSYLQSSLWSCLLFSGRATWFSSELQGLSKFGYMWVWIYVQQGVEVNSILYPPAFITTIWFRNYLHCSLQKSKPNEVRILSLPSIVQKTIMDIWVKHAFREY